MFIIIFIHISELGDEARERGIDLQPGSWRKFRLSCASLNFPVGSSPTHLYLLFWSPLPKKGKQKQDLKLLASDGYAEPERRLILIPEKWYWAGYLEKPHWAK